MAGAGAGGLDFKWSKTPYCAMLISKKQRVSFAERNMSVLAAHWAAKFTLFF